jgi:hypothetical protein
LRSEIDEENDYEKKHQVVGLAEIDEEDKSDIMTQEQTLNCDGGCNPAVFLPNSSVLP